MKEITEPLLQWFAENRREFPWREDKNPYHVWVSEIMLQQTRIEAVLNYYKRFTDALPDVQALSEIEDDALLKLWEGLGYYSRARNLKKAAQIIVSEYHGIFPSSFEELRNLPGIGDYTAGAIASICFNEAVPAVDGNVLRVISRVTGSYNNVLLPQTKKKVIEELSGIMPAASGDFNEALMELGETVCLPNTAPSCNICPLSELCKANLNDLTGVLPVRIKKTKRRREELTVFIMEAPDGCIALEKRETSGLLSGMYQLPNIKGYYSEKELYSILDSWHLKPAQVSFSLEAKHVFTHIDWFMKGYRVQVKNKLDRFIWVSTEELKNDYPLPTAFQKMLP